jgi:hypothetical protein
MVMMFAGGVVLMFKGFFVLFLPYIIYGAGVFRSRPNPYRGKAVKRTALRINCVSRMIIYRALEKFNGETSVDHLQRQTDQSQMSSIESLTPLRFGFAPYLRPTRGLWGVVRK